MRLNIYSSSSSNKRIEFNGGRQKGGYSDLQRLDKLTICPRMA